MPTPHPDSMAVDAFAWAMRDKLEAARAKGRGGWETCSVDDLWTMLHEHLAKGDPVDIANFAMMIWHNQNAPADCPHCAQVASGA